MAKSFYDLDYIIELSEKRLASLKGSYILELQNSIDSNGEVLRRKNFFFYNALIFALLAVTPYIICIGFQLSKKDDTIQKVELV